MSAAAAMRLTQLHGEPKSTLAGPAHARDGTEVPVLPWRRRGAAAAWSSPPPFRRSPGRSVSAGIPLAPIIYAVNKILDTVTPISTVTSKAGKPIKVGTAPVAIAT